MLRSCIKIIKELVLEKADPWLCLFQLKCNDPETIDMMKIWYCFLMNTKDTETTKGEEIQHATQ